MPDSLQSQLDAITAQTRTLVQPERLAVTEQAIHDLLDTGIESRVLPVGAAAPEFSLPDALTGKLVRSTDLLALGPVIVNFFRGRWCPYCVTELEAWQTAFAQARERGALLIAISPQLPRQNDFTVQQHSLTFPVLSDAGCRVAEMFGIAYTVPKPMQSHLRSIMINIPFIHGDQGDATWRLPLPATFVLRPGADGNATVAFAEAHADHRVRPDPADVLAVL
ncbi:MAG TPA: peroxiredoxin-like family protein [Acidobacteriaceae bacterium]|nr:peroxiredoxin-like family protein [Acidobacteriaceae bacterium]